MNSFFGLVVGQLPRAITPTIAGLSVGAFVGVVGFLAVMLLVGRGQRKQLVRRPVVHVPPYTLQRVTPLPPNAFQMPAPQIRVANMPFTPSNALSARALAKAFGGEESAAYMAMPADEADGHLAPVIIPIALTPPETPVPPPPPSSIPISVSPILVVQEPHPLGIIPTGSPAMELPPPPPATVARKPSSKPPPPMRAARFDDFEVDDGATEIAETIFDEPPQPRRRTDPPKIRAIAPSAPRFPAMHTPLPTPTPPPMRAASRHHS